MMRFMHNGDADGDDDDGDDDDDDDGDDDHDDDHHRVLTNDWLSAGRAPCQLWSAA